MSFLPSISSSRLLRILQKLGFNEQHQKGSHLFLRHQDGRTTTVPMHKGEDIGKGLLRKILRDIKMEPKDFKELL